MAAIDRAAQLSWSAKARFLLLITDSPAHGRALGLNSCADDQYPNGSPSGVTVDAAMRQLQTRSVELMLCKVKGGGSLDMTEALFKRAYDDPSQSRAMETVPLFSAPAGGTATSSAAVQGGGYHFVLVLDSSGSMVSRVPL